jgi:hypothetical protein
MQVSFCSSAVKKDSQSCLELFRMGGACPLAPLLLAEILAALARSMHARNRWPHSPRRESHFHLDNSLGEVDATQKNVPSQ